MAASINGLTGMDVILTRGPTDLLRLLSGSASSDVPHVLWARAIRGLVDGFVSVMLALYLVGFGMSPVQVGAVVTGTWFGSAALTRNDPQAKH